MTADKRTPAEMDINSLTPYKNNARRHSEHQLELIGKSLKKYGFLNPVLIDDKNMIMAGHGRVEAAKKIGLKTVPCIKISHLTADQKREYILADNRLAELAEWDNDLLASELGALDMDFTDLGFDDSFLKVKKKPLKDEDDAPEYAAAPPKTKPGQIWQLGEHRMMIGDATNPDNVNKLMGNDKADIVWTDPPYNVNIEGKAGKIKNDDMEDSAFLSFLTKTFQNYLNAMRPGACIYVAHADSERLNFTKAYKDSGLKLSQVLIWNKNAAVLSRQDYNWKHEPILYGWKEGAPHYFSKDFSKTTVIDDDLDLKGMRKDDLLKFAEEMLAMLKTTVIECDRPTRSDLHPTMKPIKLIRDHLEASSKPDEIVLDLFGGSGSTLIAAETCERRARIMELDPNYADVIIKRWQEFTGEQAINTDTGKPFDGGDNQG